jgi:membrane-associated phospholipid phosphatase
MRPLRRLSNGRVPLEASDALIFATLALFAALSVIFHRRVGGWQLLALEDVAAAAALVVVIAATRRISGGFGRFLARTATVSLALAYLFGAVDRLQLILHGHWLDGSVLAFQDRLLSVQPTLWLQRLVHPWLTEWMMFAYVVYIPLYPLVCLAIYRQRGEGALEECLFALALANVACDLGFILFPVAGPTAYMGAAYTVPLKGYLFTSLGEFVRTRLHYVGGSLPSPHAAAATVLWIMTWKHQRRLFWPLAPVVLSLYVATFYCRYHYATDAVTGILTAAAVLMLTPFVLRWWRRRMTSPREGLQPSPRNGSPPKVLPARVDAP